MGQRQKLKEKMSARKSTHSKPGKATWKSNVIKAINPTQDYEVNTIGPLLPKWATKKVKNSKGKIVKKYNLKSDESSVWVNWVDQFADKHAKNSEGFNVAKWSAEPREHLDGATELLEAALAKKQVWPWPQKDDEGYDEKVTKMARHPRGVNARNRHRSRGGV